jgi:hypothetical protein
MLPRLQLSAIVLLNTGNCYKNEPISKRLKRVTPAKVGARKRAENTG